MYTTPGMSRRDFVVSKNDGGKKEKLTKMYLTMYLREAYAVFMEENPGKTISFSKFCDLRPENVLLLKDTPSEQCLCQTHENFRMVLLALGVTYNKDFWSEVLCDCEMNSLCWNLKCPDCANGKTITHAKQLDEFVNREVWRKLPSKRIQRVKESVLVRQVMEEVAEMWDPFVEHVRIKRIQHEKFKSDQQAKNVRIINIDFAMNFSAEGQEEIQSALWSRASVVLFTVAIQCNQEVQLLLIVSDFKAKDKNAVFAYLDFIFTYIDVAADKEIQNVIWSDGPSSEFKNQFMCTALTYFAKKYNKMIEWKFFATSHGKGICDALGGKAKMVVREKTAARGERLDAVNNAADFARICQQNLQGVKVVEIEASTIHALNARENLWEQSKPVKGIKSAYHICAYANGKLDLK